MSDDIITKLRSELARVSGPARLVPLSRLGQALAERYWRTGPGSPEGLPDLNGVIEALEEAYGYMRDGDGLRGQVAGQLGWHLCARHVHTDAEQDRETGIRMLEEALATPHLPKVLRTMSRIQLGQLYLSRVFMFIQSPGAGMSLMTGQAPPDIAAQADRAVDCLRQVLAEGPTSADVADVTKAMLAMAETVQMTMGGTRGGFDLQRLMDAMATLQQVQARFTRGSRPGHDPRSTGTFFSFADVQALMKLDPLDRPVAYVQQAESAAEPAIEPEESRRPPDVTAPPDREQLRRSLLDKMSGTDATEPIWASAAALLLPGARTLAVDVVDEMVALARMVVDTEDGDEGLAAVDWFVLAVALYLRDRLDQGGDHADRLAGAECLLTAVRKVPVGHPAATTMMRALGAFLEEDRPFGGVLDVVADGFADRLDAVITAGAATDAADLATLHALRCLCRAAGVMAELGRAAVPLDYPWHTTLKAATRAAG